MRPHNRSFLFGVLFLSCSLFVTKIQLSSAQIYDGGQVIATSVSSVFMTDILPNFTTPPAPTPTACQAPPSNNTSTITSSSSSKNSKDSKDSKDSSSTTGNSTLPFCNSTLGNSSLTITTPAAPTTTVPPPVPLQPYTIIGSNQGQPAFTGPLPLPTTSALFPQNISSCSTCYGQFPTLSRCNVIGNTNTFPLTSNSSYEGLLPFLKCICTFKALDAYPYCIDCFQKTNQLGQLNVLQANHLENYMDALHQLCGATFNGNKLPSNGAVGARTGGSSGVVALVTVAWMGAMIFG